ncbi:MAG: DUF202 domain-containing protein [bacterium]
MNQRETSNRRVHMANERTFLAWIRTSIAIMAFGFVVERFAIFMNQFSAFLCGGSQAATQQTWAAPSSKTSWVGLCLVGLGALMGILAFVRYKKTEKQIDEGSYRPSLVLDTLLILAVASVGVFLIVLLRQTV